MTAPFPLIEIATRLRLRLFRDPCYDAAPRDEREWYVELRGRGGTLYGNDATSFWVDTTSGRAGTYNALNPTKAWVSPDGREARFLFDAAQLDAVLEAPQPRKKRTLSPENAKAGAERLAAHRSRAVQNTKAG